MIRETLVIAAGKSDIHRRRRTLGPVVGRDSLEDTGVELVDTRVGGPDLVDQLELARLEEFLDLHRDLHVELGEFVERRTDTLGDHIRGEAQTRELGHMTCEVTHALERRTHAQRSHDHPEIGRHRTLESEDVDGPLVEGILQEVDTRIGGDHLLRKLGVGALEGTVGLLNGLRHQLGDLDELLADLVKLGLKNLTHVGVLPWKCRSEPFPQFCRRAFQPAVNCFSALCER